MTIVHDEVVPARAPWSHVVEQGETLRIVDLAGNQAVDCVLYNAHDTTERGADAGDAGVDACHVVTTSR